MLDPGTWRASLIEGAESIDDSPATAALPKSGLPRSPDSEALPYFFSSPNISESVRCLLSYF